MKRIPGLTGGIASGKSTVADFLKEGGALIIDADEIAHQVVLPGRRAWQEIVREFGKRVLLPSQEINRPLLGEIIFNAPERKEVLNRIVHPTVFEEIKRQTLAAQKEDPHAIIIHDVPLLMESGVQSQYQPIILVYTPENLQLSRLMARNGFSREQAMARIRSQIPIEEKRAQADIVIDNSGPPEETQAQAKQLLGRLKQQKAENSDF